MRSLLTTSLLVLITIPVANAATVLVGIDDGEGNCLVDLDLDQGVVKLTLYIFTDLTFEVGDDPDTGVSRVIFPGVFSDTGLKIGFEGKVDFNMNTHGRNFANTQYGGLCGPTGFEDDMAGAGGIGCGILTQGAGPGPNWNSNFDVWWPGGGGQGPTGSGKTYWAGVRVKVNTEAGPGFYTVSIDPASGLAHADCTVEVNSLSAMVAYPPWILDTPSDPPLNGPGHFASAFATVGYAPGCGPLYLPMDGSFCIAVGIPEPMVLLLLAPGALLLRRRR